MELRVISADTYVKFDIDKQDDAIHIIKSLMSTKEYDISIKNLNDDVVEIGFDYKDHFKKKGHLVWLSDDEYENLLNYRGRGLV